MRFPRRPPTTATAAASAAASAAATATATQPMVSRRRRVTAAVAVLSTSVALLASAAVPSTAADSAAAAGEPDGPATIRTFNRTTFRAVGKIPTRPPKVVMRAWAIADLDDGRLLGVHDHRRWLPQASTIKLLTAVTAAHVIPAKPRHRVRYREAHTTCTCAGLLVGRRYSRKSLLTGMLLPSGNDAATALAGSYPHGGLRGFIRVENNLARRLGAVDTHVVTPSGLTAYGAHSSARDLLTFLRAAQANRVVEPILQLGSGRVGPLHGRGHTVYRGTDYVNIYPGTEGKSGYTSAALNTLVVATPVTTPAGEVHRIGVATLGAPYGHSTSGTRALTLWAAQNYDQLRAVGHLPPGPGKVVGLQAPYVFGH